MSVAREVGAHRLTLLRNGSEYFPCLVEAIEAAQQSIYFETYIFAHDETGWRISQALQRAAGRGVVVHLLLDGFGAADLPRDWVEAMVQAGVQVLWFRPELARFRLRRYRLRRLHRKLVVIDARVGFVGGINVIDDAPSPGQAPRLDYAVRVEGEVVQQMHLAARHLWRLVSWVSLRREQPHPHALKPQPLRSREVTFLIRDSVRHRRDIERAYLRAINAARQEILIANAYFLPGQRFLRALKKAARRGVRVTLLLQGQVEYRLQHYATQSLYDEMLAAGVALHEYQASFLHAKVAVVDGEWATVGSSNIDPFSLWLAREANLVVKDSGFAQALRDSLLQEMRQGAVVVDARAWQRRPWWGRMLYGMSYRLVRLLAGLFGYALGTGRLQRRAG